MWIPVIICLLVIGSSKGQQSNESDTSECPIGCPEGWTRFGFSDHCYKLPVQPATLDTFRNHQNRCQEMDPTAYIMVVNGISEQLAGSAVSLQYAFNWIGVLTNGFMWLGGYHNGKQWKFLDGTDESGNILMELANFIGSQTNNTCLSADPKTLGVWQTRPCDDKTGAAICEMPRRRICSGKMGGILPVSGISVCNIFNLFPRMPSLPFIGQLLAGSWVDNVLSSVGTKLAGWFDQKLENPCKAATPPPLSCPRACPVGWVSYSNSSTTCYKLPQLGTIAPLETYWDAENRCRREGGPLSDNVWMSNFEELALFQGIFRRYASDWLAPGSNAHLWLGGYAKPNVVLLYDFPNQGILWTLFNNPNPVVNGTCMAADFMTVGNWELKPCERRPPNGIAICEMPKKPICGPVGETLVDDIIPSDLYPDLIKQYFPNMQTDIMPFLGQLFGTEPTQDAFDSDYAKKNKGGNVNSFITCVNPPPNNLWGKLTGKPAYDWLKIDGNPKGDKVVISGKWHNIQCNKYGQITVFKVQVSAFLDAWSRCKNAGYLMTMPADRSFDGYYAFQAGDWLGEFYQSFDLRTSFARRPVTRVDLC